MYKYIPRNLEVKLIEQAKNYPIVTLMGPRQSGKTTLTRAVFPNKPYVNLEAPDLRLIAQEDPRGFLAQYPDGVIIDEVQNCPDLMSYIQVIVDEAQISGMYILTGSHNLMVHQAITQSLAGRTSIETLLPLSIQELSNYAVNFNMEDYIHCGFYPKPIITNQDPIDFYRNYLKTYVERDVRQIINIKNLNLFTSFLKLLAGRIGQVLNLHSLSNDVGVSSTTLSEWISLLEASYIIFILRPYYENFGKRVIKSPKIYFVDVGLAAYLLEIDQASQILRDPLRGYLFENLVVLDLVKTRLHAGLDPNLYFYRDNNKNEVDLIFKSGNELMPIEIKSSATFSMSFLQGIKTIEKFAGSIIKNGVLVYSGDLEQTVKGIEVVNYKNAYKHLQAISDN